jgi:hypothetical protein
MKTLYATSHKMHKSYELAKEEHKGNTEGVDALWNAYVELTDKFIESKKVNTDLSVELSNTKFKLQRIKSTLEEEKTKTDTIMRKISFITYTLKKLHNIPSFRSLYDNIDIDNKGEIDDNVIYELTHLIEQLSLFKNDDNNRFGYTTMISSFDISNFDPEYLRAHHAMPRTIDEMRYPNGTLVLEDWQLICKMIPFICNYVTWMNPYTNEDNKSQ